MKRRRRTAEQVVFEADRGGPDVADRGVERGVEGKLVSPSRRRQAVLMLQDRLGISERRACR